MNIPSHCCWTSVLEHLWLLDMKYSTGPINSWPPMCCISWSAGSVEPGLYRQLDYRRDANKRIIRKIGFYGSYRIFGSGSTYDQVKKNCGVRLPLVGYFASPFERSASSSFLCSCSISCCFFLLLASEAIVALEESMTCLREAATAEAGKIVQLYKKERQGQEVPSIQNWMAVGVEPYIAYDPKNHQFLCASPTPGLEKSCA